ncbi:Ohr family peroxiredoxin [Bradyrhizobium diazoefficiens]
MQVDQVFYRAQATAFAGRRTSITTPEGTLKLSLATPHELGGTNGRGTNSEQLFAACQASSFLTMLRLVATRSGINLPCDTAIEATVSLGARGTGYGIEVELRISLPGLTRVEADTLAMQAHALCPYCCAIRDNVVVRLVLA